MEPVIEMIWSRENHWASVGMSNDYGTVRRLTFELVVEIQADGLAVFGSTETADHEVCGVGPRLARRANECQRVKR